MTDRDRLIELIKQATALHLDYLESIDQKGLTDTEGRAKFIADHLLANGVIVPPCKVGDMVYVICDKKVQETTVFSMIIETEDSHWIYILKCKVFLGGTNVFKRFAFGKTVFLTKEEAEAKLKERGNNGNRLT